MTSTASHLPTVALRALAEPLAICRLAPDSALPAWALAAADFVNIGRTPDELSIVAAERLVPSDVRAARGYRALRVLGEMPFDVVGVMAALTAPLAAVGVPLFGISTFDTDYLLVHADHFERAVRALTGAGHQVSVASVEPRTTERAV